MDRFQFRYLPSLALAILLGAAPSAMAGRIYVTDHLGNVWRYNGTKEMRQQTQTHNSGTLMRNAAVAGDAYKDDQDTVADLASGIIYRVTNDGDIIRYLTLKDFLTNSNGLQVGTDNLYSGSNRVNGASYDPNLGTVGVGGFFSVGAVTTPTANPNTGDIERYNNLNRFISNANPNNTIVAAYNNAVLNFYDPDPTFGRTVGNEPSLPKKDINAHYYQVAGNGRLEGFESLADYGASANNRIEITGLNAFGGTGPYQARAAFAIALPEPASLLLCLGAACGLMAFRRR